MTIASNFRACETCGTRILLLRDLPPLNYFPDPAGTVAVSFANPRAARFLAKDEEPGPLEHRHSVHECGDVAAPEDHLAQRQEQQRAQWKAAVAGLHRDQRNRRGHRPPPEITGVVVQPPELPLDGGQ